MGCREMPAPCKICHYYVESKFPDQKGRCIYWNWAILDPVETGEGSDRGRCLNESRRFLKRLLKKVDPSFDPYIPRMKDVDPISMAAWHWRLIDYRKLDLRAKATGVVALLALFVSVAAAIGAFS